MFSLAEISQHLNAELFGDAQYRIQGLGSLAHANRNQLSFVAQKKFKPIALKSDAGAFLITINDKVDFAGRNGIIVEDPYAAYAQLTHLFEQVSRFKGIHPTAIVHPTARIADDVSIAAFVNIGAEVEIGVGSCIAAFCQIDQSVKIGTDCVIEPHVSITAQAKIGDRVRIHSQTSIGSEGFGFAPYQTAWYRIVQLGSVRIGNDVRIGSNCCIDRGALDDTIIEDHVIIDNLVQVAHNVRLGFATAIAAKTAIAGSTVIGKNCIIGGASAIAGHLEIADRTRLSGMSMVTKSIINAGDYSSGTGHFKSQQWRKMVVSLRHLADYPISKLIKKIEQLEQRIEQIEKD